MPEAPSDTARRYDGTTYYGRPQLNQAPFENLVVGSYVFIAGLSGAAQMLATLAEICGVRHSAGLVRRGRYLALLAPVVGAPLLIYDLHTPQRFYNMLRIFRRTSPMSIGTWLLMGFSAASGAAAVCQAAADLFGWRWPRRFARAAQVPAAITGAGLATYTAGLLSATSTPLWAAAPRALAVRFGSSSIAAGAAALALAERRRGSPRIARDLDTIKLAALAAEFAAARASTATYRRKGISAAQTAIPAAVIETLGGQGLGVLVPFALHLAGRALVRRPASAASIATLIGSLCLRVGVMSAGDASARNPQDSLRLAQPEHLSGRG
ncbi:MAG TPA: NrfD/PsrC family molybdoenzyme membrane anchor subunit [Acetobacteraceae bacterium]|nr:NrfD/PsrC family molybdoenzyme membrane anchor subunit [Acetobacteraceae bacterium]